MNFYVINNPKAGSSSEMDAWCDDEVQIGQADKCPQCGLFTSMLPSVPPIRVELTVYGIQFPDIAKTPSGELLVSEKVHQLYRANGLSGWERIFPAEVVRIQNLGKKNLKHPVYFLAGVCLGQAVIDFDASGLDFEPPICCVCCESALTRRTRRVVIKEGTWNGKDIFRPRGMSGDILITEKFKSLLDEDGAIFNAVPAEEFSFDFYPKNKG